MDKTRQPVPPQLGNQYHIALLKTFLITSGGKKRSIPKSAQKRDRLRWPLVLDSLSVLGNRNLSFLVHKELSVKYATSNLNSRF